MKHHYLWVAQMGMVPAVSKGVGLNSDGDEARKVSLTLSYPFFEQLWGGKKSSQGYDAVFVEPVVPTDCRKRLINCIDLSHSQRVTPDQMLREALTSVLPQETFIAPAAAQIANCTLCYTGGGSSTTLEMCLQHPTPPQSIPQHSHIGWAQLCMALATRWDNPAHSQHTSARHPGLNPGVCCPWQSRH